MRANKLILCLLLTLTGCTAASLSSRAGRGPGSATPDAPPASPRDELLQQAAGTIAANIATELSGIRQSTTNAYDPWTLRLQTLWPMVLAVPLLTYIAPKVGWRAVARLAQRWERRRESD
ncbi:MAG TPA: hypothetical protein PLU99_06160 [Phycisphaerae bacterium]|nr:hypothetical protein [Phycisphaerae bacterium]